MLVTPETEVRLLNDVPLNNSYEHQLTFNNASEQTSFFLSKTAQSFLDFTYVKEDSSLKVPRGRDSLYSCNYLMFRNKDFSGKWFYGFITKLEYVNPETTKVHFELDVFQTWQFDFTFRPSYISREHTRRWNSDGTPVINTVDEGLDYGADYETVAVENVQPYDDLLFLVVVSKSTLHYIDSTENMNKIVPSVVGVAQPLQYYIYPFKKDGTIPNVTIGGTALLAQSLTDVLKGMMTNEHAVNNVVSMYITDHIGRAVAYNKSTNSLSLSSTEFERVFSGTTQLINVKRLSGFNPSLVTVGNKYDGYAPVTESKLLMHPYTVTVLDDFKGNRAEIKNEHIQGNTLQLRCQGALSPSNKVVYQVVNYLQSGLNHNRVTEMEHSVVNNNPNDLPIITDMLSAYLQGNRNSIENQKNSIVFNATMGAIGGAVIGGGAPGALMGATGGLANSYYQIMGLNAKKKDIQNTPPQLVNMGGNTAFDYGNGISGVYVVKKQITAEYRKRLTDFFKMFGYRVNELKTPNLKSRTHYNYIQTEGANLTGNVPQEDLRRMKQMFDQGITLWHGDWVGDYSRVNGER